MHRKNYTKILFIFIIIVLCGGFAMYSYSIPVTNKSKIQSIDKEKLDNNTNDIDNVSDVKIDSNEIKEPYKTPQEIENNRLRKEIENEYDIQIYYGNELKKYDVLSYSPELLTDSEEIKEYLNILNAELKKYPEDFFKEMKTYNMELSLYLIKDLPNSDVLGYTDYDNRSKTIITIICEDNFRNTLHHEIMHFIDYYINKKDRFNDVIYTWSKLNPENYSYGTNEKSYVYSETKNKNSYFLNNYAQTNYLEDRAVLFGDIMSNVVGKDCYVPGTPLYKKIDLLSQQLDKYFDCINYSLFPY